MKVFLPEDNKEDNNILISKRSLKFFWFQIMRIFSTWCSTHSKYTIIFSLSNVKHLVVMREID